MARARTPQEIRSSVDANRGELGLAVQRLRDEVQEATDWRKQLRLHHQQVVGGAAAVGFVLGGGIGGFLGLFKR
jgi:hypothetical protein